MSLAILIPSYGHFDYAAIAAESALTATPDSVAFVIDDASPDYEDGWEKYLEPLCHEFRHRLYAVRFPENGGLTRSWNYGLQLARNQKFEYACCGNSDLIFSDGWFAPIKKVLDLGIALAGPLTNAPGTEAKQDVRKFLSEFYTASDDPEAINGVARLLRYQHGGHTFPATLNGFCMVARTETWWANAFDAKADHVFNPCNTHNSGGRPNPTPLMTLNEYELQRRWHAAGLSSVVCADSFVFHYRSVSRGEKYAKGQAVRREG